MNDDDVSVDALGRILDRDGFSPELPRSLAPRGGRIGLGLQFLLYMLKGVRIGTLEVHLPNGERRVFAGTQRGELHGVLNIRDGRMLSHVLRNGEVGFGEAYLDGMWDSPDLAALLAVMYLNEPHYLGPYEKNWLGRLHGWWQHRRRANTRDGAKENIQHHYDLGNEFYKLWLDPTMAYSSAVFTRRAESSDGQSDVFTRSDPASDVSPVVGAGPGQTLQDAQLNKFRLIYERLDLQRHHHLLEIGSGWGGFAIYAAQRSGCRVTSITLSEEQLREARVRAWAAGVADRVRFELCDYRDVRGTFDRVASIEMYEAVGEEYWPAYFQTIARVLAPGGRAAIQGITIAPEIFEQYRTKRDFIQKYIFPGGMLASPDRFMRAASDAGLRPEDPRFFARDYADTLALWHRNVLGAREAIARQFGERFLRMWRYYLAYCECGFRVERVNLMQVTLAK